MPLHVQDDEEDDGAGWRYADVDLKPMMAIFCILIPLLMFSFSFFEIKVAPVAAPKIGVGPPAKGGAVPEEQQKTPLNLTVILTEKGFIIKANPELVGPASDITIEKKKFQGKNGNLVEDYDYPTLYTRLLEYKRKYPDEKSINIGAEASLPWEYVVKTIDTARVQLKEDRYDDMEKFMSAPVAKDDQGNVAVMFPQVFFVVAE